MKLLEKSVIMLMIKKVVRIADEMEDTFILVCIYESKINFKILLKIPF